MSLYDYVCSRKIEAHGWPFYALIMAAMQQADSNDIELLKTAFPTVWRELKARDDARGGVLPGEGEG